MEPKRLLTSRGKSSSVFLSHEFTFKDREDDIFWVKFSDDYQGTGYQPMKYGVNLKIKFAFINWA